MPNAHTTGTAHLLKYPALTPTGCMGSGESIPSCESQGPMQHATQEPPTIHANCNSSPASHSARWLQHSICLCPYPSIQLCCVSPWLKHVPGGPPHIGLEMLILLSQSACIFALPVNGDPIYIDCHAIRWAIWRDPCWDLPLLLAPPCTSAGLTLGQSAHWPGPAGARAGAHTAAPGLTLGQRAHWPGPVTRQLHTLMLQHARQLHTLMPCTGCTAVSAPVKY